MGFQSSKKGLTKQPARKYAREADGRTTSHKKNNTLFNIYQHQEEVK